MKKPDVKNLMKRIVVLAMSVFLSLCVSSVYAGVYLDSAHGDSSDGVKRSAAGFPTDYAKGLCAHCHEQHSSIGGSEPAPSGGPDDYLLFNTNHTSQTDNFCYNCHTDVSSYQTGGIVNRSYSYRAGNWSSDTVNDIKESFSYTSPGTSHNLDDIKTFITGKSWGYTSDSNPCNACHNPHAAQGDPIGAGSSAKTSGTRGYPVSLPSLHSKDNNAWGLWGDGSSEQMNDYTLTYQAPYRYGATVKYEPDASGVQNGSNLTDYVTFCTDCHNITNTIYSTTLGRNLYQFNWALDKHGAGNAANDAHTDVVPPYLETSNYVLSCTDCHEPHGSSNSFLIRKIVNGGTSSANVVSVTTLTNPDNDAEWKSLCLRCHGDSLLTSHHNVWIAKWNGDYSKCSYCHEPESDDKRNCLLCHYHGNQTLPAVEDGPGVLDYNEKLF